MLHCILTTFGTAIFFICKAFFGKERDILCLYLIVAATLNTQTNIYSTNHINAANVNFVDAQQLEH